MEWSAKFPATTNNFRVNVMWTFNRDTIPIMIGRYAWMSVILHYVHIKKSNGGDNYEYHRPFTFERSLLKVLFINRNVYKPPMNTSEPLEVITHVWTPRYGNSLFVRTRGWIEETNQNQGHDTPCRNAASKTENLNVSHQWRKEEISWYGHLKVFHRMFIRILLF